MKKKVNYESYFVADLLQEKVFFLPENRIGNYAVKFKKYESAVTYLLKHKLNYYIETFKQKSLVDKIQKLEEIVNSIKPLLKNE